MERRQSLLLPSIWAVLATAACFIALILHPGIPNSHQLLTFGILAALVALAPFFAPDFPDAPRNFGTRDIFVFAGALLLSPLLFVLLALVAPFIEWVAPLFVPRIARRDDRTQPFVIGARLVSGLLTSVMVQMLSPSDLVTWSVALALSGLTFFLAHQSLPIVDHFLAEATGVNTFVASRGFDLTRDFLLLMIGGGLAALWMINVWVTAAALLQLLLIYRVAQIPGLEMQAQTDGKTGLWNSRHFDILFRKEIERASRFERQLAVMMADLDLMRNINNRYGHLAGDVVLRGIGEIIRKTIREYDIAARFGGEEFVIVLPETDEAGALAIAERIRTSVSTEEFHTPPNVAPIRATMSIGVAAFPTDATTAADLLHFADRAVYAAKARGRNNVVLASTVSNEAAERRPLAGHPSTTQPHGMPALHTLRQTVQAFRSRPDVRERGFAFNLSWAIVLLICGLVSGVTGILAAEQALPGDGLYPLKAAFENTRLMFTGDEGSKAVFEVDLARSRFEELTALVETGREAQVPIAALSFSDAIGRAAQTLTFLRARDPYLAERLTRRATLEWREAITFLHTLDGKLPPEIESSIALTVAAVDSQAAMLEGTVAEPRAIVPAPQVLATATPIPNQTPTVSSTPDEGTQLAVALPSLTPVPISAPPAATQVAVAVLASTPSSVVPSELAFTVDSPPLIFTHKEDAGTPIPSRPAQVTLDEDQTIGRLGPIIIVARPVSPPFTPISNEPTRTKDPKDRCSTPLSCKRPFGPPPQFTPDIARLEDLAGLLLSASVAK